MAKKRSITTNYKAHPNQKHINQIQHVANSNLFRGDCISENELAIAF